jgi:hypothetical protein
MYDEDCVLEVRLYRGKLAVGSLLFSWRSFGERGAADLPAAVIAALRDAGVLNTSEQDELEDIGRAVMANFVVARFEIASLCDWASRRTSGCRRRSASSSRSRSFEQNFPEADDLFE